MKAWGSFRGGVAAALLVLGALLATAFRDVVFRGGTLTGAVTTPSIHPWGLHARPAGIQRVIDPGACAWQDEPFDRMGRRSWRNGSVPLWNPGSGCGAPLLANQASAVLYPLTFLRQLLPVGSGWEAFLLGRLLLAGWGTFLWLRLFSLSWPALLAGAVAFLLNGHHVLYLDISSGSVDVLPPFVLWAVEHLVRGRGVVRLALVTAAVLVAGSPEGAFFALALGGLYLLVRIAPGRAGPRPAALGRWTAASALGTLLAAPAVLPFLEYLTQAVHGRSDVGLGAWPAATAILLVAPEFFRMGTQPEIAALVVGGCVAPYVGLVPALLALVGLGARGTALAPLRWFLAAVAAFYVLKAHGAPLVNEIGRLPLLRSCVFQKHLFPAFALAVAALAAAGVEALRGRPRARAVLVPAAALLALLVGWRLALPPGRELALADAVARGGRIGGALVTLALGVAAALAAALGMRRSLAAAVPLLLVLAAELVLLVPGERPPRKRLREPPFVRALRAEGADRPGAGRVLATGLFLAPNWGAALGFEDVRVMDALNVRRYVELVRAAVEPAMEVDRWMGHERAWYDPDDRWLRFLGVQWLVAPGPQATALPVVHAGCPTVYRNERALPRAFVVHRAETAPDDACGLARLTDGGFDPSVRVLLHEPVAPERLDGRGAPERDGSRARVRRASPRSVRVDAELEHAGFLVVSDAFYPGWEAEVDGKPAPLLRANHAFRAVWLERGAHRVRFRYRPGPWRVGLALAAVAALALAVVAAAGRRGAPGLALLPRRGNDGSDA